MQLAILRGGVKVRVPVVHQGVEGLNRSVQALFAGGDARVDAGVILLRLSLRIDLGRQGAQEPGAPRRGRGQRIRSGLSHAVGKVQGLTQRDFAVADHLGKPCQARQNNGFVTLAIHRQHLARHAVLHQQYVALLQAGDLAVAGIEDEGHAIAANPAQGLDGVLLLKGCDLRPVSNVGRAFGLAGHVQGGRPGRD